MADALPTHPTGTVTFLFTDVEGSTRLWEEASEQMARALEKHDSILRSTIEGHGGYVFSTAGDAFSAAFTRAGDALAAAVDAQRLLETEAWPEAARLRVRMGVHTGEAFERDGDYFGSALNRSARIMSAGHGGQILVSEVTAGLLTAGEFSLGEVGTLQLRGLSQPEVVSQVFADGLATGFPPLRSQVSVGNLPADRDLFVGREREVSELGELIRNHRLVTLTGVGGVGKTRLATTCGWRWSDEFDDGVWLVSLAEVGSDDDVAVSVAGTIGLQSQPAMSIVESVAEVLSGQRVLLILDNCEHVLDGAAELVEQLLSRPGRVTVLATSREGLGIAGERLVAVRSLETAGEAAAAIELFVDRATAAGWTSTDEDEAVAELCRRLDGVPLAIELAAARARSMPVREMVERLNDRFRLLTGRRRGVERHQTLRAAVSWSYDLLSEAERLLSERLSVFAGPFMLADAEAVCADDDLDRADIDLHLGALVDKSMVIADDGWFRMLETLSQFGAERFGQTGGAEVFRDNHLAHFTELAVGAGEGFWSADESMWVHRVDTTWANFRAAVEWAVETENAEAATVIVARLTGRMNTVGNPVVGPWTREVLAMPGVESARFYPSLLARSGFAAIAMNDVPSATAMAAMAREALEAGGADIDQSVRDLTVYVLGFQGHFDQAIEQRRVLADEAKGRSRSEEALFLGQLAFSLSSAGQDSEAVPVARRALELAERAEHPASRIWCRFVLGNAVLAEDPEEARVVLEELLELELEPSSFVSCSCRCRLARIYSLRGEDERALTLALDAVRRGRRAGTPGNLWNYLMYMAITLETVDESEVVAQLLGGMANSWVALVPRVQPWLNDLHEQTRSTLGEERAAELVERGSHLSASEAAELAERAAMRHLGRP